MDLTFKTPQKARERFKRYYQAHKEKYAAFSKKWWKEHPEQLRAKWKRHALRHRDARLAKQKARRLRRLEEYRTKNLEWQRKNWAHRQEYMKRYYRKNADTIKQRSKATYQRKDPKMLQTAKHWRLNHPEKVREYNRKYNKANWPKRLQHGAKRRALKRQATIGNTKLIADWMSFVKSKQTAVCYYCRKTISTSKIHFDHIVALNNGGAHSIENLCVSCSKCNFSKNDTPIQAWYKLGQQVFEL